MSESKSDAKNRLEGAALTVSFLRTYEECLRGWKLSLHQAVQTGDETPLQPNFTLLVSHLYYYLEKWRGVPNLEMFEYSNFGRLRILDAPTCCLKHNALGYDDGAFCAGALPK